MSSVDQRFLLDYIQSAARAVSRGADLPTLSVGLLPNGQLVQIEGYASEEEARGNEGQSEHDYTTPQPARQPVSVPAVDPVAIEEDAPPARKRRPTLASVKRQADKAGIEVAKYEFGADGKIAIVPGKPEITITEDIEIKTSEQLRRLI
jgi:hypothetical protein